MVDEHRDRQDRVWRSRNFWMGLLAGILALLLIVALGMFLMMSSMGGCPMCGRGPEGSMMMPGRDGVMSDGMMSDGMMSDGTMSDMRVIRTLLAEHGEIERSVEEIPNGVRTVTTSEDPQTAQAIRKHVWQMKKRLEQGQPIRMMDPVFREIFEHASKVQMKVEEVPGGTRVTETSRDPQVTLLIRQHAQRAVSEFVDEGMSRTMQPTPLPDGYRAD